MHLKGGGKIEIGNKGDRTYVGRGSKHQQTIEEHLAAHADKHVRDWAAKTQPAPPPPRRRELSPEQTQAAAQAKQAKQEQRATARAEKTKAREAKHAERQQARATREQARAQRHEAKQAKRAEAVQALQAINAPIKDGKLDRAKVPGATKDFQPLTTLDPASGYKGRSFKARNADEMSGELLGAAAGAGTNEHLIEAQLGHLNVKDPTQWEAISEKYETGPIETYADAIKVLAKASAGGGRQPDWSSFDFEALQSCPGLERLQPPGWLQDAKSDQEQAQHMANAYAESEHHDPSEDTWGDETVEEPAEHPGHIAKSSPDDVPFER